MVDRKERGGPAARLKAFLESEMAMSHIYQPVMIRTIPDGGGAATKRQIAAAISASDLSQIEYYEQVVSRYPAKVLRKRGIVDHPNGVFRLSDQYRRLNEWERAELSEKSDLLGRPGVSWCALAISRSKLETDHPLSGDVDAR